MCGLAGTDLRIPLPLGVETVAAIRNVGIVILVTTAARSPRTAGHRECCRHDLQAAGAVFVDTLGLNTLTMQTLMRQSMARLAWREVRVRWVNFALTWLAVGMGAAVVVASLASLAAYDRQTESILARQADKTREGLRHYDRILRNAMRELGFNVVILPENQQLADFYADDYADATMPEAFAEKLAEAKAVTIGHWVPVLRHKTVWTEKSWTILIVAFGRPHTSTAGADEQPDVPGVPPGSVDVGWELHRALDLQAGQRIRLRGKDFTVRECLPESGSNQDVTVRMNLRDAQHMLDMNGRINEIRALQCRTAWNRLDRVKTDIQATLPGVRVIQKRNETVTIAAARRAFEQGQRDILTNLRNGRAEQRVARVRLSSAVSALTIALALVSAGVLAGLNAGERRVEIALWNALGVRPGDIHRLFAWRALGAAVAGSLAGWLVALPWWGWPGISSAFLWAGLALAIGLLALFPAGMTIIAITSKTSPAEVLKNDV